MTGLIVFKISKKFIEVRATSGLFSTESTQGSKVRHIIFIIIESGMALFAIQLLRVLLSSLLAVAVPHTPTSIVIALQFVIAIHKMLNVIMRSVQFHFFCFTDNIYLDRASHQPWFSCGFQWDCPSMTKNPSKLSEAFILMIPQWQVIRIHLHLSEWEVVVAVCRPRRGMRIFVLIILQMQWEVVVRRLRRGSKLLKDIDILAKYGILVIVTITNDT